MFRAQPMSFEVIGPDHLYFKKHYFEYLIMKLFPFLVLNQYLFYFFQHKCSGPLISTFTWFSLFIDMGSGHFSPAVKVIRSCTCFRNCFPSGHYNFAAKNKETLQFQVLNWLRAYVFCSKVKMTACLETVPETGAVSDNRNSRAKMTGAQLAHRAFRKLTRLPIFLRDSFSLV